MQRHLRWLVTAVAVLGMAGSALAGPIVVHTSDFIPDATRTFFNSFEAIPTMSNGVYTGGNGPYTEGGLKVEQINGRGSIWAAYNPGGRDGDRAWYPNGGDYGYTSIQLACGADFGNVGFLVGSGGSGVFFSTCYYQLWNDGALVLAGSLSQQAAFHYLGFEGGGFDTILLRDGAAGQTFLNGTLNALALDAIEVGPLAEPVCAPEPSSLALLGVGVLGVAFVARRRRAG